MERVTFIDLHTATKAGLSNWLLDKAEQGELAELVVLEEIEKVQPLDALLPLVSLMGSGYVAKMNAFVGNRKEVANILVLATCNDENLIRTWRNGALWSRFAHHIHCSRPSRPVLHRILLDKVEKMGGDPLWVDKAMEFAFETLPENKLPIMDDPRAVKGLLDGRDRLLDNSYQVDLMEVIKAEVAEARCTMAVEEFEK